MKYLCSNCFCESVNEQGICTACGHDSVKSLRAYPMALPPGTILYGRYVLGRVLGQGVVVSTVSNLAFYLAFCRTKEFDSVRAILKRIVQILTGRLRHRR